MVGDSKILTVSYGTFSCTLEGFDEPFSTMKAIAEYFRDLAAGDRYFGAEPPTPDAEMLHRIAEREIQRRVEAKISEHGVVLRANGTEETAAVAAPVAPEAAASAPIASEMTAEMVAPAEETSVEEAPVAEAVSEAVAEEEYEDLAAAEVVEEAVFAMTEEVAEAEAETAPTPDMNDRVSDSVAAKLSRIRAVVAAAQSAPAEAFEAEDVAEDFDLAAARDDFGFDLDLDDAPVAKSAVDAEAIAPEEIVAAEDEYVEDEIADTIEADAAEDTIHAVMAGIAAEEEAADALEIEAPEEAFFADDQDMMEADDFAEEANDQAAEEAPEGDEALDLGAWRLEDEAESFDAAEEVTEEFTEEVAIDDDETFEDAAAADAFDDDADATEELEAPVHARILKIRKAEIDAIAEAAEDQAYEDDPDAEEMLDDAVDEAQAAIEAAFRDPADDEEMADAAAEEDAALLAGIGDAIGDTDPDTGAEDNLVNEVADAARDARRDGHEGRAILESNASGGDESIQRLMEEAKSKLEGDESRRRFSAISHLKAAVAATVADRKLKSRDNAAGATGEAAEEIKRYRDDLSKAVRPRRHAVDTPAVTRRPTAELRPAPLILVSEQRVDAPSKPTNENAVIRPRRINMGNLAFEDDFEDTAASSVSTGEDSSFAEFAERMGVTNLSDLLEAAAAYTATVEGQPLFSRPQILRKIADFSETDEYSREDGLRSFGMLLRQGKLRRVNQGQFKITDASRFVSEARRAAH